MFARLGRATGVGEARPLADASGGTKRGRDAGSHGGGRTRALKRARAVRSLSEDCEPGSAGGGGEGAGGRRGEA